MSNEKFYTNGNLCSIIAFAVIVRWSISLHSYSGEKTPPMFGDYEAQRHWMEITVNVPIKEWYFNSSKNDLMYWGLDYPPLTAYHSYINGKVAGLINSDFVDLQTSRGYESYSHKFFMRSTVIVSDLLVYFISAILFCNSIYENNQNIIQLKQKEVAEPVKLKLKNVKIINSAVSYLSHVAIILLYPGIIIIDHGHFQYNSVSLGFTILSTTFLFHNNQILSAIFFCLALNYKQMSLYYSLPLFVFMLRNSLQFKKFNFMTAFKNLFLLSLTVFLTFGIMWYPFLTDFKIATQVLKRLFPLSRGIFEDKVSNIWCTINIFYKLNQISDKTKLAKICICSVLGTSIFSLVNLFKYPSVLRLVLSFINVSLSFFLFSYQVHEKTILLVALPILLLFPFDPLPCFWFLLVANFSMFPLILKDNLLIPFISLNILFSLFVFANVDFQSIDEKKSNKHMKVSFIQKKFPVIISYLFKLSLLGYFALMLCSLFVKPPSRYPDLWPLLMAVYSFLHFFMFKLYFNVKQVFLNLD